MMDAEAFTLARNAQLKQLTTSLPQVGVDTAQANWIFESINEKSLMPYLAAVILLLKTAAQDAVAAACSNMTAPADLFAFARQTADTNNHQALLFSNKIAPPTPTLCLTPDYSQGPAAIAHGEVAPMTPVVEIQTFDNGGICTSTLSYSEVEAEEGEERIKTGFQTDQFMVGTQTVNNLAPPAKYAKAWSKDMQLGAHTNKLISCYISKVTKSGFEFKSIADLKAGDLARLMAIIPPPDVLGKAYDLSKYTKHKHPADPTGLDPDEMTDHKIPAAAQKVSDELAKEQLKVRERLTKLHLPANECAMQLFEHTRQHNTPAELKDWITTTYPGTECEEGASDALPEAERFEGSVHEYISPRCTKFCTR
jgi:hypothetical protein